MSEASSEQARLDYDKAASSYSGYNALPSGQLKAELIRIALSDYSGYTVLDLGGGIGYYARTALEPGATAVDLVNISAGMIQAGRELQKQQDTEKLRFWQADIAQPLNHLPLLSDGYNIIMANWIFSFAGSTETLYAILANIRRHLKPSGRFIGVRNTDPWSPVL